MSTQNQSTKTLLIYGATGYTGKLIASHARESGLKIIIAGKSEDKLARLAGELGTDYRVFEVDDALAWQKALKNISCVLNAAGPFRDTARQAMEACIQNKVHYLDISAEYEIFDLAAKYAAQAAEAGIMLISGVGMMVSIDSLAYHTAQRVSNPVSLCLGFKHHGSFSRGTIITNAGAPDLGVLIRREHRITKVDSPEPVMIDFGDGPETCFPFALGGTLLAYKSTGIPNIKEYFQVQLPLPLMETDISKIPDGPTSEERDSGREKLFAEITDTDGAVKISLIDGPSGYTLTYLNAVQVASEVLAGNFRIGYQSPASAYGDQMLYKIPGLRVIDL